MKFLKAILRHSSARVWQFCSYLFWPQMGRQRHKQEQLKKDITYLIGKEIADGNTEPVTPLYVSRMLNVPLEEVEKAMKEIGI